MRESCWGRRVQGAVPGWALPRTGTPLPWGVSRERRSLVWAQGPQSAVFTLRRGRKPRSQSDGEVSTAGAKHLRGASLQPLSVCGQAGLLVWTHSHPHWGGPRLRSGPSGPRRVAGRLGLRGAAGAPSTVNPGSSGGLGNRLLLGGVQVWVHPAART